MHLFISRKIASRIFVAGVLAIMCMFAAVFPGISSAQSSDSSALAATIRAAIEKDPRSATLPAAQIDSMVQALTIKAQEQGLTVQDIAYMPNGVGIVIPTGSANTPVIVDPCTESSACSMGRYLASGVVRNPIYDILWVISFFMALILWHARKNFHLLESAAKKEVPAIGGRV